MRKRKVGRSPEIIQLAIPRELLEAASTLAPRDLRGRWARIVRTAVQQFLIRRKREHFAESMAEMARDPQAMAVNRQISMWGLATEVDGLTLG